MTGFPGRTQYLVDKALAAATIADASQSNVEIFIAAVHRVRSWECLKWGNAEMRPEKSYLSLARGPRDDRSTAGSQAMLMAWLPPGAPLLPCVAVVFPLPSCLTAKHANSCDIARNAAIPIMARPALTLARRDRQQLAEWGSAAQFECQIFAPRLQAVLLLHHRSADAQTAGA